MSKDPIRASQVTQWKVYIVGRLNGYESRFVCVVHSLQLSILEPKSCDRPALRLAKASKA